MGGWVSSILYSVPEVFQHSRFGTSVHRKGELVSPHTPAARLVVLPAHSAHGRVHFLQGDEG